MKRIVYLTTARLPTEKAHGYQICKMCEAFADNRLDVTLVHPFRNQPEALHGHTVFSYYGVRECFQVQTLANADIFRVEHLMPSSVFQFLFVLHSLVWSLYAVRQVIQYNADLYYTRDVSLGFWLTLFGMPTVLELHTVPAGVQQMLLRTIRKKKSLFRVVALTSFIKQRLVARGFPEALILVLPDAVDFETFSIPLSKKECRKKLGLSVDASIVGYVGRFTSMGMEKGVQCLIEAAGFLKTEVPSLCVLCVGGPLDRVARYTAIGMARGLQHDQMRFVDRVPNSEVPYWIKACDIATIPWMWNEFSAYFTSPMKLFEYMAAGVPIVASDLPSLREVLRHGENAWLVNPGDPVALASGIKHVVQNPELGLKLACRAQEDVLQHTWQKRAERALREAGFVVREKAHGKK